MNADGWFYVSSPRLTGAVRVERGTIVETPPILKRFIGQPPANLGQWLRGHGDARFARLAP